jgi:integrase
MWPQKHRSGNVTWKVYVGKKNDGRKEIKSFISEVEAENFKNDWNVKFAERKFTDLKDLDDVARHEVLASLKRLEAFNATLPEAVNFFLAYARPAKGQITINEAIEIFVRKKTVVRRSAKYIQSCQKTFFKPFSKAFPKKIVSEMTPAQAEDYINRHKKWGPVTRNSHIGYLTTLYEFLIKENYAKINPFKKIQRARHVEKTHKILPVEDAKKLLQINLDKGYKAECSCMALALFCGVRVEGEMTRLTWENIDFEKGEFVVAGEAAKMGSRFPKEIPENCLDWLKLCKERGPIAPGNYIERMKRARQRAGILYPQNAMRHSFASYHLHKFHDPGKTAYLLAHDDPKLFRRTYYHLVTDGDAKKFFEIIPDSVRSQRNAEAERKRREADEEAKEEAEAQSNCGRAVFLNGKWVPVTEDATDGSE